MTEIKSQEIRELYEEAKKLRDLETEVQNAPINYSFSEYEKYTNIKEEFDKKHVNKNPGDIVGYMFPDTIEKRAAEISEQFTKEMINDGLIKPNGNCHLELTVENKDTIIKYRNKFLKSSECFSPDMIENMDEFNSIINLFRDLEKIICKELKIATHENILDTLKNIPNLLDKYYTEIEKEKTNNIMSKLIEIYGKNTYASHEKIRDAAASTIKIMTKLNYSFEDTTLIILKLSNLCSDKTPRKISEGLGIIYNHFAQFPENERPEAEELCDELTKIKQARNKTEVYNSAQALAKDLIVMYQLFKK